MGHLCQRYLLKLEEKRIDFFVVKFLAESSGVGKCKEIRNVHSHYVNPEMFLKKLLFST